MTDAQKETYLAWLADAHAMEMGLATTLEKQIKETEGLPDAQAMLKKHLEETRIQAEKVEACLRRNGGDPSMGKDLLSKVTNAVQGAMASLPQDALIKNMHMSFAAEQFEIAAYTLIASAAEELGDPETAKVAREILPEEQNMAAWLMKELPMQVKAHLSNLR